MELFPPATQKLLLDKGIDKQTQGALAIEDAVKLAIKHQRDEGLKKIVHDFYPWILGTNYSQKRAGMFALSLIASVIMREDKQEMAQALVSDFTQPVLEQMENQSEEVRIFAFECLYYLSKSLQGIILINFRDIFEALLKHTDEEKEELQMAVFYVDSTLKNIVNTVGFDLKSIIIEKFIPTLQQRMSRLKSVHQRSLLLTWIKCLHGLPNIEMFLYLPQLLDGLFTMCEDPCKEIRNSTDYLIGEFFKEIEYYSRKPVISELEQKVTEQILLVLIQVCMKGNNLARLSAVLWIFEYLRIYQAHNEEESPKRDKGRQQWSLIVVQGPQGQQMEPRATQVERELDPPLRKIIIPKVQQILEPILELLSHEEEEIRKAAQRTNGLLLKILDRERRNNSIEFVNVVHVVKDLIKRPEKTAEQALIWINHLLRIYSNRLLPHMDTILTRLIDRINDAEGPVMENVMEVIGTISMHDQHFDQVIEKILYLFQKNRDILANRCDFIVKKLCGSLLDSEKVYEAICTKMLSNREKYSQDFISKIVQSLEYVLITERHLQDLRQILRTLRYDEQRSSKNQQTFVALFKALCYNPISAISICFLAEEYELAYSIIISFAEYEMDVNTLLDIGKLVNMIESTTFAYLRLQLLENQTYPFLLKSLQGLMMLLPQGETYSKLKARLKYIDHDQDSRHSDYFEKEVVVKQDYLALLQYFCQIRDSLL